MGEKIDFILNNDMKIMSQTQLIMTKFFKCVRAVFILVFVKVEGSVEIYSLGDFGIHRVWLEEKLL